MTTKRLPAHVSAAITASALVCLTAPLTLTFTQDASQGWACLMGMAGVNLYRQASAWLFRRWERTQPTIIVEIKPRHCRRRIAA